MQNGDKIKINLAHERFLTRMVCGGAGAMVLLTVASALMLAIPRAVATEDPGTAFGVAVSDATVNVAASCSMTATIDTAHSATIPNGIYSGSTSYYPNGIGQTTIKTFCNDPNGYAVYAVGYTGGEAGITAHTNTVLHSSTLGDSYNIATGTATGPGSSDVSNWAMKIGTSGSSYVPEVLSDESGSYASFHAVPSSYTKVAKFTGNTDVTVGSSITTTYAAYISGTQPAGTYTGKVKYSLVHPSTAAAPNADYMQTVADWSADILVGQEVQVTDQRDGKAYTVARLCTNYSGDNCTESQLWMTQNLDLEIGGTHTQTGNPIVLDSTNTNITTAGSSPTAEGYSTDGTTGVITWTPSSSVTTSATNSQWNAGNNATVSGWTNETTVPHYMDGGDHYVYNGTIYNTLSDCTAASHTEAQCRHYHVGNYYNFTAAVASNNTSTASSASYDDQYYVMPNSICPKGWRLPNGLTSDGSTVTQSEFNKLLSAQGVAGGTDTTGDQNVGYADSGWSRINTTGINGDPLYFARSGSVYDTTLYYFSGGGYWSSTVQSGSVAYYLYFNSGGLYPTNLGGRYVGRSVRCVAE